MPAPTLLRGISAIASHLGISNRQAAHLDQQRQLPTFNLRGSSVPCATAGGLDEWRAVSAPP